MYSLLSAISRDDLLKQIQAADIEAHEARKRGEDAQEDDPGTNHYYLLANDIVPAYISVAYPGLSDEDQQKLMDLVEVAIFECPDWQDALDTSDYLTQNNAPLPKGWNVNEAREFLSLIRGFTTGLALFLK